MTTAISPVVIIGAPRSGTNMLRDALVAVPGLATWPCDEINTIWRHGNLRHPSDEFPPGFARPGVSRFIRGEFVKLAARAGASRVVEKTCANALRVGFVEAILPEARYVHIRRDPVDAVASALKRWRAPLDLRYVLRKARFVPRSDIFYYASRYLANRLHKLTSADGQLATWGPRFDGMDALLGRSTLPEVCAHQWRRCVTNARRDLEALPPGRVCNVGYEKFVGSPAAGLRQILEFLGVDARAAVIDAAVKDVRSSEIGRGSDELADDELRTVKGVVDDC